MEEPKRSLASCGAFCCLLGFSGFLSRQALASETKNEHSGVNTMPFSVFCALAPKISSLQNLLKYRPMKNVFFALILTLLPFCAFCQADESPQKSGSVYIETGNITGDLSAIQLNPMVGLAVSDNFVLSLGFSNIVNTVVQVNNYWGTTNSIDQQTVTLNLGGRFFTKSNIFFGGGIGAAGAASGTDNTVDDLAIGVSLRGEIGKYFGIGNHFYAAPKMAWSSAAVGDDDYAVGVAGTQIAVSLGIRLN